jgi:hypothetical protein
MVKTFLVSCAFVLSMLAIGCSAGDQSNDESASSTAADDLKSGQQCGGFVAHPKSCPSGYECIASGIPDMPGHCHKEKACVEDALCETSEHFDTKECRCVPN